VLFGLSQLLSVLSAWRHPAAGAVEPAGSTEVAEPVQGWRAWRLAVALLLLGVSFMWRGWTR
jgi:hypothetical protein